MSADVRRKLVLLLLPSLVTLSMIPGAMSNGGGWETVDYKVHRLTSRCGDAIVQIRVSRAPEDSDPIYNYFLVNIWIQVNPEDDFSVRYVSVSAEPEGKPLYFYVLRYSPTTSSGSVTHGFNLGFDLGVSSSGPSGSVGVGYSSGITMPMLETIDDSDLYWRGIK